MRTPWLVAFSIAIAVVPVNAKSRNWETGTLLRSTTRTITTANVTTEQGNVPGVINGGSYNSQKESEAVVTGWQEYIIQGGEYRYLVKQPLQWRWSKPAVLTLRGPVKFAVEGRSFFVVDETGKEYKMELLQRGAVPAKRELGSNPSNKQVDADAGAAITPPAVPTEAEIAAVRKEMPSPSALTKGITVRITSTPSNAEIDVDGNYWGSSTPTADLTRLPAGTHTITVKKIGYKPWERKIELAPGDDRSVNAELEVDPTKPRISGLN